MVLQSDCNDLLILDGQAHIYEKTPCSETKHNHQDWFDCTFRTD